MATLNFENTKKNKLILGAILLAMIVFSQNLLSISYYVFGDTLIFKILFILGGAISLLFFKPKFSIINITLITFISFSFLFSYFIHYNNSLFDYFISFVLYVIPAFCYANCKSNEKYFFNAGLIFGCVWLLLYLINNNLDSADSFSFGYLLLPLSICSLMSIKCTETKIIKVLKILIFLISTIFLFLYGSRGPVFCFVLFLFLFLLPFAEKRKFKKFYFGLSIVFLFLIINYESIIIYLHNNFLENVPFIEKSYFLFIERGEISNGRFEIITEIFNSYSLDKFIFGIGIGSYGSTHSINQYTHNIFLSICLDFGIVSLILLVFICFSFFYKMYKHRNNFLILLFSLSILILFFSGEYWESYTFWLFIFIFLNYKKERDNDKIKKRLY